MTIGISTATYFGKSLTEDSFALIEQAGASVCEIFLTTFYEYKPEFAALIKQRLGKVKVHSIHTLNSQFEPQLYNTEPRTYLDAEEVFKQSLHIAKEVNAHYYTFHGVARLKKKDNIFNYEKLGQRTQQLCKICEDYGVQLCFENVHWAYYNFEGFFKNLLKYCPDICACLDIKQAMQSEVDYKKLIEDMSGKIKTVHICDYDASGKLCLPGKGIFDFEELFRMLSYNGYQNVPVLLELYSGDYKSFDEVKQSFDYIKAIAQKY